MFATRVVAALREKPFSEIRAYGMILARNALGLPNRLCTPDRETLERVILPAYAARAEIQTVLFVGSDWYTRHYERLFAGRLYWTIDPNPWKKRFGGRHHLVDGLERLDTHFEPGSIDLIVCNGVVGYGLNGQAECERAFTGCFNSLRANGELVLGWNDVPEHRPEVAFDRLPALARFEAKRFDALGTSQYLANPANRHLFNFYIKPGAPTAR